MIAFRFFSAAALVAALAAPVYAQRSSAPPPTSTPAPVQPKPLPDVRPVPVEQPSIALADAVNVRLELSITDTYGGTPLKKVVSMLVASGQSGRIRTNKNVSFPSQEGTVPAMLNLDAALYKVVGDRIPVEVTFEYLPAPIPADDRAASRPAHLSERISVVLRDGKPLLVSQSADPASDRKVTVELMATVVK